MTLISGNYLGPYRLLNLLMTGQSSEVWEVVHDVKQQRFALKALLPDFTNDREHRGYLQNEFMVGKSLEHDRVIKMFEQTSYRGELFLILELFPVPNLKAVILREPERAVALANKIIRQAAEGLAYFHKQGWIHRDVKPDNFLVSAEGDVKLIDFALAIKRKGALGRLLARRTKVQGTRSYMSPEQIRGRSLDLRSDIYSFGCMLYEMLGGKPPYTGVSTQDLLMKHIRSAAPALDAANRSVSSDFAGLARRMIAKNPDARPQTMDEFLTEFGSIRLFKDPPRKERVGEEKK